MKAYNSFIEAVCQMVPLTKMEIKTLRSVIRYREYKKDDLLSKEGTIECYMYYILEGGVRAYYLDRGEDLSLDFFFSGTFTTSYMSFLLQQKSVVNMQALFDTKVIRIHHADLMRLYARSRNFNKLGRIATESLYIKRTKHTLSFITQTAKERYDALLKGNKDFVQQIPQKYLASFLGIRAESLSRIRKSPQKPPADNE